VFIHYDRSLTTFPAVVSSDYPLSLTTFSTILTCVSGEPVPVHWFHVPPRWAWWAVAQADYYAN
jgi:hypothetical protein